MLPNWFFVCLFFPFTILKCRQNSPGRLGMSRCARGCLALGGVPVSATLCPAAAPLPVNSAHCQNLMPPCAEGPRLLARLPGARNACTPLQLASHLPGPPGPCTAMRGKPWSHEGYSLGLAASVVNFQCPDGIHPCAAGLKLWPLENIPCSGQHGTQSGEESFVRATHLLSPC